LQERPAIDIFFNIFFDIRSNAVILITDLDSNNDTNQQDFISLVM